MQCLHLTATAFTVSHVCAVVQDSEDVTAQKIRQWMNVSEMSEIVTSLIEGKHTQR